MLIAGFIIFSSFSKRAQNATVLVANTEGTRMGPSQVHPPSVFKICLPKFRYTEGPPIDDLRFDYRGRRKFLSVAHPALNSLGIRNSFFSRNKVTGT